MYQRHHVYTFLPPPRIFVFFHVFVCFLLLQCMLKSSVEVPSLYLTMYTFSVPIDEHVGYP